MLELTTKRPMMKLRVDGEEVEIPLTFTARELAKMNGIENKEEVMFSFFEKYIPGFDNMGDDALNALVAEWTRQREELGEPSLGK